jgi:Histidine kinase
MHNSIARHFKRFILLLMLLTAQSAFAFTNLLNQSIYQLDGDASQCDVSLSIKNQFSFADVKANRDYCLLIEFTLDKKPDNQQLLFISALASTEIILDGKFLAMNGQVGNKATDEIPGNIEFWISLSPEQLNAGPHKLLFKLSTHNAPPDLMQYVYGIFIQDQEAFFHRKQLTNLLPVILSGGLALVAVILFIFSISLQQKSHWWIFCLLCASASILLLAEVWRSLIGYAYPLHILRLNLILFMAGLFSLLLPWYFLSLYQIRKLVLWLVGIFSLILLLVFSHASFDSKVYLMLFAALIISLIIHLFTIRKLTPTSLTGLIIIGFSLVLIIWQSFYFAEQGFALIVCLLLMSLVYQLIQEFRYEKAKAAMALQLENQLLHRSLQPHFLMNSLALINELIYQDQNRAEKFIEALATEFRLLNQYVRQPTISLLQELELCHNYLQMMTIRHQLAHQLVIEGDASGIIIPPAVLLTLLENAFSHNHYQQVVEFNFKIDKQNTYAKLVLQLPVAKTRQHQGIGIGNLYIEQSLQQVFAGKASCHLLAMDNFWLIQIELPL